MSVFRLVLGIAWLGLGAFYIVARDRMVARRRRRGKARAQPPMVWIVLGGLHLLIGACWIILAFV